MVPIGQESSTALPTRRRPDDDDNDGDAWHRLPSSAEEQWAMHRETIRRLYLDENMTLRQVVGVMKKEYGFSATLKTYKARMKAWGYRKNISLAEGQAQHIARLLGDQPSRVGGSARLEHGAVVSVDRLATYLRRRKQHTYAGRDLLLSLTAQLSSASASPEPPDLYYVPEGVMRCITDFNRGHWGRTISTVEQINQTRDDHLKFTRLNILSNGLHRAVQNNQVPYALFLMRQVPQVIEMNLKLQPFPFIGHFFMLLCWVANDFAHLAEAEQLSKVVKSLIRYLATWAVREAGLVNNHPLRHMLNLLTRLEPKDLVPIARQALRVNCESLEALIQDSRKSHCTFGVWIIYGREIGFLNLPSNLGENMKEAVAEYKDRYGPKHSWTSQMNQVYAWYLHYLDSARGKDPYLNDETRSLFEQQYGLDTNYRGDHLEWLSASAHARNEREAAERYMRELIEYGVSSPLRREITLTDMVRFESWLLSWGEDDKAAELARWREQEFKT